MEMMTAAASGMCRCWTSASSLAGMISIGDVVKTRIAETVSEANSLRDYISTAV